MLSKLASFEDRLVKLAEVIPTTAPAQAAGRLLQDPATTASGCMAALRGLFGDAFVVWEPETIWLTLERRGIQTPLVNRDKILAAVTLMVIPAFWWEVNAFSNTVCAFNDILSQPDALQEVSPAALSWGVYEAELLFSQSGHEDAPVFDREPTAYTAVVLHRAGFFVAPDLLSFAQDALDTLNKNGALLTGPEVKRAWKAALQKDDFVFDESPLGVQLSKLAGVRAYVLERTEQYARDLDALK